MKYYTKEWYDLMQKNDISLGMKKIPDKDYSDEEIEVFYNKQLKKFINEEKKAYEAPPFFFITPEDIDTGNFNPDDWIYIDEETGEMKHFQSAQEISESLQNEQKQAQIEYENRPAFNPDEAISFFKDDYHNRTKNIGKWFQITTSEQVDSRLLALGLLPESVYNNVKQQERENKKRFQSINKKAKHALTKEYQKIPEKITKIFHYHDANLLSLKKIGTSIVMELHKDGYWDMQRHTPYDKIIFHNASFIERERNIRIHKVFKEGNYTSNVVYLYDELYKTEFGYEYHLMVTSNALGYITIRCEDISLVENIVLSE